MANPVTQLGLWFVGMLESLVASEMLRSVLAGVILVYLGWMLLSRVRDDSDHSFRYSSESAAGSTSILVSGVHLTMLGVAAVGFLTWPQVLESRLFAAVLLLAVLAHYALEKNEAMS